MKSYTWLELWFSKFKWVRKRSKAYWVRHKSGDWVKFTDYEMKDLTKIGFTFRGYTVEDWRENV